MAFFFFLMFYHLEMDTEVFTSGMINIWDVFLKIPHK